jgi:hypothetical protein
MMVLTLAISVDFKNTKFRTKLALKTQIINLLSSRDQIHILFMKTTSLHYYYQEFPSP